MIDLLIDERAGREKQRERGGGGEIMKGMGKEGRDDWTDRENTKEERGRESEYTDQ